MKGILGFLSTLPGRIVATVLATSVVAGSGLFVAHSVGGSSGVSGKANSSGLSADASSRASRAFSAQQGAAASGEGAANVEKSGVGGVNAGIGSNAGGGSLLLPGTNPSVRGLIPSGPGGTLGRPNGSGSGGSNGGNNPSGGGSTKLPGANVPGAPSAPGTPALAAPSGASLYSNGSMTVYVPALGGQSWKLCVGTEGEVQGQGCAQFKVLQTKALKLTVSYSGNASAKAPTFTTSNCPDGSGKALKVTGLTPGASVTATAGEESVTKNFDSKSQSVTASLCEQR
ncbi:MAG: hypothetical protein M3198_16735 [Actinomycetota bacterium]|nr:hypothetical protein [Actinomycetota bacterium]